MQKIHLYAVSITVSIILLSSAVISCKSTPPTKTTINLAMANFFNSWLSTYGIREGIITSDTVDVNITLATDYETQILAGKFPMGAMATATFAVASETSSLKFTGVSTYIVHEGALKQEGVNVLYTRADSKIQSPADLVGKKVGVPELTSSATSVFLGMLKQSYGIREDQLTLVNKQNPLLLELLRNGDIDAAMLGGNVSVQAFVNPAFKILWNLDKDFYAKYGDYFFPSILIVENGYLAAHRDVVKSVYELIVKSNAYGEQHMSELAEKYAASDLGQGQTADFYRLVFNEHSRTKMKPIEGKTLTTLTTIFSLVKERGIITKVPNPADVFTTL
jgi:ABC-type nitrate/sulfonate/bicarbonate transport system substrate-binding protein